MTKRDTQKWQTYDRLRRTCWTRWLASFASAKLKGNKLFPAVDKITWENASRFFCLGWNKTVGPSSARLDLERADRHSTCGNANMENAASAIGMRLMWLPYYPFEKRERSTDWQYHISP